MQCNNGTPLPPTPLPPFCTALHKNFFLFFLKQETRNPETRNRIGQT